MAKQMPPRNAPVVWNDRAIENEDWARQYRSEGYVVLKQVFSPETMAKAKSVGEELSKTVGVSTIFEGDGKTVRSVFDAHKLSSFVLNEIVRSPELLMRIKAILGKEIYLHQCHYNFKNPQLGGEFFWHSDYTFWHWEDGMPTPRAVTALIFLDKQRIETGPLMVVPGSHQTITHPTWSRKAGDPNEAVRHDANDDPAANGLVDAGMLRQLTIDREIEPVMGFPGDVMLMDANLVHASGPNIGCHSRNILLLCFNSLHNTLVEPFSGGARRPTYISSREYNPL